jgi:hypothetical protein
MAGHFVVLAIAALLAVITRETAEEQDQRYACQYSSHKIVFNTTKSYHSGECYEYRADAKSSEEFLREFRNVGYHTFRDSEW